VSSPSPNSTSKVPTVFGVSNDSPQENRTRYQETTRRTVNGEDTSSKAMMEINGAGFDWSYMADDEAPTNMAFMALSDSKARCKYHQRERMVNRTDHSRGHSHKHIEDQGYFNNGCSMHMIGNISYLTDFIEFDGGYVAFGGGAKGGKITGKVARIEAIRLFLAYASFMGFLIYQMDDKSAFLYGRIEEEQTVVATSTTEAKYVATASCCGQILWI
nr:putative ribonuclease H-like domain-containing protein [Tanacetum cinerariifolium]